jgi:hypothetical protein
MQRADQLVNHPKLEISMITTFSRTLLADLPCQQAADIPAHLSLQPASLPDGVDSRPRPLAAPW